MFLSEAPGGYAISAHNVAFAEAMAAAEDIMREDRDILAVLARRAMREVRVLDAAVARAVHDRQFAEHGGLAGVRDDGLLESVIAPAEQGGVRRGRRVRAGGRLWLWRRAQPSVRGREQAYRVGDRAPVPAAERRDLAFDRADAIRTMLALVAGELDEETLADRFRSGIVAG